MPPLLEKPDHRLSTEALGAIRQSGHNRKWAIIDASYNIPAELEAEEVYFLFDDSAVALGGLLRCMPIEGSLTIMKHKKADFADTLSGKATEAFKQVIEERNIKAAFLEPAYKDENKPGFYTTFNEAGTLFIRTADLNPFACVGGLVGHSQFGNQK